MKVTGAIAFVALVVRTGDRVVGARQVPARHGRDVLRSLREAARRRSRLHDEWPDGAVTYAAHYPVGYPAILSLAYRVYGESVGVAMGVNAFIGAAAAAAAHRLALRELPPGFAAGAAFAIALHPALLLYVPALMTESVAASLAIIALACAPHARDTKQLQYARIAAMGLFFGVATLVRPQMIALAPLLAFVVTRRLTHAGVVLAAALLTCAPWTARNCVRMEPLRARQRERRVEPPHWCSHRQRLVDAGRHAAECREVWDEAGKDACFERAARREIIHSPGAWLARIPRKLAVTFDVFAAGPYYLHRSNPRAFDVDATVIAGGIETFASRLLLALSFVASVPLFRLRVSRKDWTRRDLASRSRSSGSSLRSSERRGRRTPSSRRCASSARAASAARCSVFRPGSWCSGRWRRTRCSSAPAVTACSSCRFWRSQPLLASGRRLWQRPHCRCPAGDRRFRK